MIWFDLVTWGLVILYVIMDEIMVCQESEGSFKQTEMNAPEFHSDGGGVGA